MVRSLLTACFLLAVVSLAFADGVEIRGPLQTGTKVGIGKVEGIILRVTDDGVYVKVNKDKVEDSDDPETARLVELYKHTKWDRESDLLYMPTYIASGVRIRITTRGKASFDRTGQGGWAREEGMLLAVRESELGILFRDKEADDDTSWVSVEAVSRVEVATGDKSGHTLEGALIGLAGGTLLGIAAVGIIAAAEDDEAAGYAAIVLVPGGAGVGLVLGGTIGSRIKSDKWRDVPMDELQLGGVSTGDAPVLVGLRVRF